MVQSQQVQNLPFWGGNMPPSEQPVTFLDYKNKGKEFNDFASGDDSENGSEEGFDGENEVDREENACPFKHVRWTKDMGKLLITAVSYFVEGTSSDLNGSGRADLLVEPKKGKWRAISKVMVERGFMLSPQQCEDKFCDLNKRYKRLNDILRRGTCCNVVEYPTLLEFMNIPFSAKEEVLKMLSSEDLFYQEMYSYHNGNHLFLPHDWALYQSLQVALYGKYDVEPPEERFYNPDNFEEVDKDGKSNDGVRVKRLKQSEEHKVEGFNYASNMKLGDPHPPNDRASANQRMMSQLLEFQEKKLRIQEQMLELEKRRFEWLRINRKEVRKLDKMRLENERMKLENVHLETELKPQEVVITIFYKLAANDGMSLRVLIAYRFIFATATVVPLALYVDRKCKTKPTGIVLRQAFLCSLFGGTMAQNLFAECLILTSATFASAMTNLIPAITFTLAVLLRMERLELGTNAGKAKVFGTLICIGGAMVLTFFKGAEIHIWTTNINLLHGDGGHVASSHRHSIDHILASLLGLACCFSNAFSLISQAKMSQMYPYHYTSTGLISIMGAIQAVIFAICMERDWNRWKLGWNIRLLTVTYGGTVASGLMITFMMWCVRVRGPLFVSIFSPLMLVIVAMVGSLFINEKLHLGSVLGSVIIITGLYMVLWGKSEEIKRVTQLMPAKSSKESEEVESPRNCSLETNTNSQNSPSNILGVAPNFVPIMETTDDLDENISVKRDCEQEEAEICRLDEKV